VEYVGYDRPRRPVVELIMDPRTKYPRTFHLPWSPGRSDDDKVHTAEAVETMFAGKQVVVTEKVDGENTTVYSDGTCHARSMDSKHHESRTWVKALAAKVAQDIPKGWRVCGENVYARHSIGYETLPGYFLVFGIYDENNVCLSWDETVEWAEAMGLPTVPVLYRGEWNGEMLQAWTSVPSAFGTEGEGYVVRTAESFDFEAFGEHVAKFVRKGHVQTGDHWMNQAIVPNGLAP